MLGILERIFPSEHVFNSYFVIHKVRRPRTKFTVFFFFLYAVSIYAVYIIVYITKGYEAVWRRIGQFCFDALLQYSKC